jgi:hypothetical protein
MCHELELMTAHSHRADRRRTGETRASRKIARRTRQTEERRLLGRPN